MSAGFCPIVYLMLPHLVLFPFPIILIKGPCFDIFNTVTSSSVAPSPLLSFLLVLSPSVCDIYVSVTRCFQKLPSNHSSLEAMMLNSTYSCASSTRRADRLSPGFGIGPGQARAL